jgi:short-subunit dehydrogenase
VSKFSECELFVQDVLKNFGSVDILVNNAGINGVIEFSKASIKRLDHIIDINLKGQLYMARCVLPSMIQAGRGGHILNIGTMSTKRVEPYQSIFTASKMSVLGWTYSLRAEMKREKTGVTVHIVNPGILSDVGCATRTPALEEAMKSEGCATGGEAADGVVKVIKYDIPEMTVNSKPWAWEEREPLSAYFKSVSDSKIEAGLNK